MNSSGKACGSRIFLSAGSQGLVSLSFPEALAACLDGIPRGKVATCGTIAKALGDYRAARSVATWLLEHPAIEHAHRVVRADGRPLIRGSAERLDLEGVKMHGGQVPVESFVDAVPASLFLEGLRAQQTALASRVIEADERTAPEILGGLDVAYRGDRAFAVAVTLDPKTLEIGEVSECETEVDFPYIPTYLAFREFPAVKIALDGLEEKPDLLFVDGHGRLHPALFGFACFAGVQLDLPTIGIAKHPLAGRAVPAGTRLAGAVPIEIEGVVRGYAWAPPGSSRPFYVSVGHRIALATALAMTQRATKRKYPEPLVVADRISKEKKEEKNKEEGASGPTARPRPPAQGRRGV